MRVLIAGLGVQGEKRKSICGDDFVTSVDPINPQADFKKISDVPLENYDAVLACIPDSPKSNIIEYCLNHGKHVLVEKPLWTENPQIIAELESIAKSHSVVCYTAYNHRFEPHLVRLQRLIKSGKLGRLYSCRLFYGNGTARLVRNNRWRDLGGGVLTDLGSHLLDLSDFLFGDLAKGDWELVSANYFENNSPDHGVIELKTNSFRIECEMTFLMWRNNFTCDIIAEYGSAHVESLCKWGPSTFIHRERVFPSGRPTEKETTLIQKDPTWLIEYEYFKELIRKNVITDLSKDRRILEVLTNLERALI